MAAKNTAKPRPNKNSDGQNKRPQPTMSHDIHISPGKPAEPPTPPGAPQPGASNPMTHPAAPGMQSTLGTLQPPPDKDQRQVQERIQFKDLSPVEQSQTAIQQGLDPYAPIKMVQAGVNNALQQGPSTSPVPHMLTGPYVPPGVEGFPDDMAHLSTLMSQGFAPGASGQEHEFAQNAHAMAMAKLDHAMQSAQQGVGQQQAQPYAPQSAPAPMGQPTGPPMGSSMQSPVSAVMPMGMPPIAPGAPGGIPPAMIAAMLARHKGAKQFG
jgi:hypothetical protein